MDQISRLTLNTVREKNSNTMLNKKCGLYFLLLILFCVYVMSYLRSLQAKYRGHARQKPRYNNIPVTEHAKRNANWKSGVFE
jgi:hypothetical protein